MYNNILTFGKGDLHNNAGWDKGQQLRRKSQTEFQPIHTCACATWSAVTWNSCRWGEKPDRDLSATEDSSRE